MSRLADGLLAAMKMQREREARADDVAAAVRDRAGMLRYLSGWVSKEDPEASGLLGQMADMLDEAAGADPGPEPGGLGLPDAPLDPMDDFNYVGSRHHY